MNHEQKDALRRQVKKLGDLIDTVLIEQSMTEQRVHPEVTPSWGFSPGYKPDLFDGLEVKWETGGYEGGNWRNGEAKPYATDNPPLELTSLMAVIDDLFPDISFRDAKQLLACVVTDKQEVREYYGNYTNFTRKRISVEDIYRWTKLYDIKPRDPSSSLGFST